MSVDPRDQIWNATYETYYAAFYEEVVSDSLIQKWQLLDETTKILVAFTASGSAVSGWALWNQEGFKYVWASLAGISAVLALAHTALDVAGRLRDHGDTRKFFSALRIDMETFRYRMQVDPEFPVEKFTELLVEYRRRYGEGNDRLRADIMLTDRVRDRCQSELNHRLGSSVIQDGGQQS